MDKKILVYNMPEEILEKLYSYGEKYGFETLIAEEEHLGQNVGYLLGEEENKLEEVSQHDSVDINFLMLHNFERDLMDEFLEELKKDEIFLPNKCISTETNKSWKLHELLVENLEESQIMPLIGAIYRVKAYGEKLIEEGNDDQNLISAIDEINNYMEKREFEKEEMRELYNKAAKILNEYVN